VGIAAEFGVDSNAFLSNLRKSPSMPATEIFVSSLGRVGEKELLVPTGQQGKTFAHLQDWMDGRLPGKSALKDISNTVLIKGIKQWTVLEEKAGAKKIRTVFKIT
jgi:hypothetical protein